MTKPKSNAPTAVLESPVSMNIIPLQIRFSKTDAPKPDGLNLWIDIDINLNNRTALFHCQEREVVGTHKQRKVTYRADHDCRLKFSNVNVFDEQWVDLMANQQKVMHVKNTTKKVGADYAVDAMVKTSEVAMGTAPSAMAGPELLSGPHIVVP